MALPQWMQNIGSNFQNAGGIDALMGNPYLQIGQAMLQGQSPTQGYLRSQQIQDLAIERDRRKKLNEWFKQYQTGGGTSLLGNQPTQDPLTAVGGQPALNMPGAPSALQQPTPQPAPQQAQQPANPYTGMIDAYLQHGSPQEQMWALGQKMNPYERPTGKDASGFLRYLDGAKERVFPDAEKPNQGIFTGSGLKNQAYSLYHEIGQIPEGKRTPKQKWDFANAQHVLNSLIPDPNMPGGFRKPPPLPTFGNAPAAAQPAPAVPPPPPAASTGQTSLEQYFAANENIPAGMEAPVKAAARKALVPKIMQVARLSQGLFQEPGAGGVLGRATTVPWETVMQNDPRYKVYNDIRDSVGALMARADGETGALRQEDIERSLKGVPDIRADSAPVAKAKWKEIAKKYGFDFPPEFYQALEAVHGDAPAGFSADKERRYQELKAKEKEGTLDATQ